MRRVEDLRHQIRLQAEPLQLSRRFGSDGRQLQPRQRPGVPAGFSQPPEEDLRPCGTGEHQPAETVQSGNGVLQLGAVLPGNRADAGIGGDAGTQSPQRLAEGSAAVCRTGDDNLLPLQGKGVKPVEFIGQGTDLAHHDHGGALYPRCRCFGGQLRQGGDDLSLPGQSALFHHGGRGFRVHPRLQQPMTDPGQGTQSHQKHQRSAGAAQRFKIDPQGSPGFGMAGDNVYAGAEIPVGHGDSGIGRGRQRGGHSGDHLKGNFVLTEQLQLFTAPAEQEGVAALQPHHPFALPGFFQQDFVDPLLGNRMVSGLLAHIDPFCRGRDQSQNLRAHQPVVDHHLGLFQGLTAFFGQQTGISRSGAYQNHIAYHRRFTFLPSVVRPEPGPGLPRRRQGRTAPLFGLPFRRG